MSVGWFWVPATSGCPEKGPKMDVVVTVVVCGGVAAVSLCFWTERNGGILQRPVNCAFV